MIDKDCTILVVIGNSILESTYDDRSNATSSIDANIRGLKGSADWDDPRLYTDMAFGNQLRNRLSSLGNGYGVEVTDYNKWVSVRVTYHDTITGISVSKTFLIIFQNKGNGLIMNTANRYRTISGVDQAVSYIKSVASILQSRASSKV